MKKTCNVCLVEKDLIEFYKIPRGKYGVRAQCKKCFDTKYSPKERDNRKSRRIKVIQMYGGRCAVCNDSLIEHLTIDHINGNGFEERKIWRNSNSMYLELQRRGYPKENYQVLCWNCNTSKHIYGKPAILLHKELQAQSEGYMGEGI
jgi:5-methylcytosine-specific restriction endonuclease McrA